MRRGHVRFAGVLLSFVLWIMTIFFTLVSGGVSSPAFGNFILIIFIASLLLGERAGVNFALLSVLAGAGLIYAEARNALPPPVFTYIPLLAWLNDTLVLIIATTLLYFSTRSLKGAFARVRKNEQSLAAANVELQEIRDNLERRVSQRTAQLDATIEVGRAISFILDPVLLTREVVNLVTDHFGYYYAAIFLVDDTGHWAILRDASGEAGQKLLEQGHRLEIGGQSMVGTAVSTRQPRIAFDVGEEAIRFDNPLLPNTRSELALPIIISERVLGALDVQSVEEAAFSQQDIETLQNVGNQIAVALENARLFQETKKQLEEIDRLNQLYLQEGWREFTTKQFRAIQYSDGNFSEQEIPDLTALEIANRERSLHIRQENDVSSLTIPITFQEHVIGAINLKAANKEWTGEEISLVEAVSSQAALALENARLIRDTQRRAAREQLTREVTDKMRRAASVESILRTAVNELYQALGASQRVFARLEAESSPQDNGGAQNKET
ncbi:MAG: GAF domain-containing protein [Anaerolineales bacterium]